MTKRRPDVDEELTRRISSALDRGGVNADPALRALLDEDDAALRIAQDFVRIDEVLKSLGASVREPDWNALAARIEARLDAELAPLDGDVLAPPHFIDDGAAAPSATVREASAGAAAPSDEHRAPVVDLAAARGTTSTSSSPKQPGFLVWGGGLAAAAAVGLGIVFGLTTLDGSTGSSAVGNAPAAAVQGPARAVSALEAPEPMPAAPAPSVQPQQALFDDEDMVVEHAISRETLSGPALRDAPARDAQQEAVRAPIELPETPPTRAEILAALARVERSVQRCLERRGDPARVSIQIGVRGNAISTRVDPPYVGTEAACIVDVLREAELPRSPQTYQFVHVFRPARTLGSSAQQRATSPRSAAGPARPSPGRSPSRPAVDALDH